MKNPQFPAGVKPSIQATITEESGKKIQLSNKDFLANSLCFKNGTTDQGSFTVGGGIIGSVSFSLINEGNIASAINYVNATVEISLTAGGQTVDMGKYWFIDHTGNNNLVKCDAYDALQIFDEHQLYESSITYPTTAKSLASLLVTARGFKITGLPTVDVPINNPQNDDMTERECLRYLAQLLGMYVVAKGDTIVFGTYSRTTKHDAGTSFSHNLRTEAITITDVVVNANKQQAQQTAGAGGYVVTVDNNPFINEQNTALVQANLDKNIKGLSFHPGTYDIKANPAIDAGDCLLVQTRDARYTAYVTNFSYKIQLQQAIKSDADNYIGDRRISKKPKTFIEIVKNATQSQISNDLKNPNSELSQAIGQGGSGSGGSSSTLLVERAWITYSDEFYPSGWKPADGICGTPVAVVLYGAHHVHTDETNRYKRYDDVAHIIFKPFTLQGIKKTGTTVIKGIVLMCHISLLHWYYRSTSRAQLGAYYVYNGLATCNVSVSTENNEVKSIDIHIIELHGSSYDNNSVAYEEGSADLYTIVDSNYGEGQNAGGHIITGGNGCFIQHTWI